MRNLFEQLFESKDDNECWPWLGAVSSGRAAFTEPGKRATTAARVAWRLYKGAIPDGLQVLHRCDNMMCVNPSHLFLGTRSDNMVDMVQKDRHCKVKPRGEDHGNTKLSDQDFFEIVQLRGHMTIKEIAAIYGVSFGYVSHIQLGKYKR